MTDENKLRKKLIHEVWKPIDLVDGMYEVSNLGRVRSVDRVIIRSDGRRRTCKGKMLKLTTTRKGYNVAQMQVRGSYKPKMVHRLVANAFIGPCPDGMEVNHIDENRGNNRADNLEYLTHRENLAYGQRCEKHNKAVSKPVVQYTLSGEYVAEYSSRVEASEKTGINHGDICQAVIGKRCSQAGGYRWKDPERKTV